VTERKWGAEHGLESPLCHMAADLWAADDPFGAQTERHFGLMGILHEPPCGEEHNQLTKDGVR
jgi:hypothetical protein